MYLSKVLISGTDCRNPYEIHRVLWKVFAEDAEASRDFLFRIVQSERMHTEVLMQSLRKPERSTPLVKILASKEYLLTLHDDQLLRFFLVANPVKTINDEGGRLNTDGGPKKCRVPLVGEEEHRAWLERKLKSLVLLETLITERSHPIRFMKNKENRVGKIQPVCYQGILIVKDARQLSDLVKGGIGPGKAFGCGLLSLARA